MQPTIKVKLLSEESVMPVYSSEDAACFDLGAITVGDGEGFSSVVIPEDSARVFGTGIAVEIPKGYCLEIYSRSGHGFNKDLRLSNCVGIIDADYRGEIKVKLRTDGPMRTVVFGERIAQAKLVPVQQCLFERVAELGTTLRGTGGFGSTG